MKSYTTRNARAQFADVIGAAQYGGETVEITKHGKAVAKVMPANASTSEAPALESDLAAAVDAYATDAGLDRAAAIAALLRAGLAADTTTATIVDLFPEVRELDAEAAHEVILGDQAELGESVEYDYDGQTIEYGYARYRGRWIFTVSRPTDATDAIGCRVWEHDYTVCASRSEAQAMYREAIITASKDWREGSDSMWFDMLGGTFDELARDRVIPLGSFGAEALDEDE